MKKVILALMCAVLLIPSACASGSSGNTSSGANSSPVTFGTAASVPANSAGPLSDTVTLPASMFQGQDLDDIRLNARKSGVEDVNRNKDGSVTYKMSQDSHKRLTADTKQKAIGALRALKKSMDYPFIGDVLFNDDFSQITLVINKSQYNKALEDDNACNSAILSDIGAEVSLYQMTNGAAPGAARSVIQYRDQKTDQVFKTCNYPNDLKTSGSTGSGASSTGGK